MLEAKLDLYEFYFIVFILQSDCILQAKLVHAGIR